jgi:hypothetical protein
MQPEWRRNPRNLRDQFKDWVGKKVNVGLKSFHYICGTWKGFDGLDAVFTIGGKDTRVPLDDVDNVADAPEAQAEFYK